MIVCYVSTHTPLILQVVSTTLQGCDTRKRLHTEAHPNTCGKWSVCCGGGDEMVRRRMLMRLLLSHVLVLLELSGLTAWYSGNALHLYVKGAWLKSWLQHRLS
jgi:hypothetical protein